MEVALSRYIITAIKQATCWQDLEALLQAYPARTFNHIHLSALVCRLPKLVQPARLPPAERSRFARFLGHVSDAVSLALPTFDPRAIANTLWAVCKLGYSPAPPLLNKFLFEAYVRMDQFNAQELANLSWALATLAAMGNRPVPVWMLRFTQAAQGRVLALKPQELAHTAWALSKLCPSAQADTPAAPTSTSIPTPATPNPASSSQQSSASSPSAATAPPGGASGSQEGAGGHPAQLVAALTARALDMACRDAFAPGELVTSLLALHNLDHRAGRTLLLPALVQLMRRGRELSPQDLANLWSVAMRHCAPAASASTATATAASSREAEGQDKLHAHGVAAKRHSRVAALRSQAKESWDPWAAASSGSLPGRHHLYALVELTEGSLHAHTAQGLCAVLVAWVQLQLSPSEQGVEALYGRLSQVLPAQATFQGVSVVLWASARLQLRPPNELMHTMLTCARLQAPTAKPRDLVAMAWALQQLRYRPPAGFFPAFTARIRAPGLLPRLHPYGVHVLLSLYVMCDLEVPAELQEVALAVAAPSWSQPRPVGPHALTSAHPSVAARFIANLCGLGLPRLAEKPEAAAPRAAASMGKGGSAGEGAGAGKEVAGKGQGKEEGSVSEGSLALRRSMRLRLTSNPQLRARLRSSVEAATLGRMQQLNNETFCALVNAFARLRARPSEAFVGEVHREASSRAAGLAPWQAATLVRALARLEARPPAEVLSVLTMAVGEGMGELTGPQLLLLLGALARLRYRPPAELMKVLFFRCMKSHKDWPARDLHGFMRDLATLGLQLPEGSKHCRQLRLAVYRKKLPKEPRKEMLAKARVLMLRAAKERRSGRGRAEERGEGWRGRRGIDLGAGEDMKAQLCRVCVGLSGCPV